MTPKIRATSSAFCYSSDKSLTTSVDPICNSHGVSVCINQLTLIRNYIKPYILAADLVHREYHKRFIMHMGCGCFMTPSVTPPTPFMIFFPYFADCFVCKTPGQNTSMSHDNAKTRRSHENTISMGTLLHQTKNLESNNSLGVSKRSCFYRVPCAWSACDIVVL